MKILKKTERFAWLAVGLVAVWMPASTSAADTPHTKQDNNWALTNGASWSPSTKPGNGTDTLIWDSTVATAANCTNTIGTGGLNVLGIRILNPVADVSISDPTTGISVQSGGIDMSAATRNLTIDVVTGIFSEQNTATWNIPSGRTMTINGAKIYFYSGSGTGKTTIMGGGTVNFFGGTTYFYVMSSNYKAGTLEITNATVYGNNKLVVAQGVASTGTVSQLSGSAFYMKGEIYLGNSGNCMATYDISGGLLSSTNNVYLGPMASDTNITSKFIVRDAGTAVVRDLLMGGKAGSNGTATVTLKTGGTLSVRAIATDATVVNSALLVAFDGGTLKPTTNNTSFFNAMTQKAGSTGTSLATLSTNGAVIDTAGFNVTIAQPLADVVGQAGRLVKLGAGTLNLTNAHTFTGPVVVSNGVLCVTNGASIASTSWMLQDGTLQMRNDVTLAGKTVWYQEGALLDVIGTLTLGGTLKLPKFTAKKVLLAQASNGFSGETSAVTVDAPTTYILKKEATQLFAVQQTGTIVSIQ